MNANPKSSAGDSPVFARGEAARPRVRASDSPFTLWLGMGGAVVLGALVFNGLSAGREAKAATVQPAPAQSEVAPAPPPPPPPPAPAAPAPVAAPALGALIPAAEPESAHWRAPTVVVDLAKGDAQPLQLAQSDALGAQAPAAATAAAADPHQSADERFSARMTGGLGDVARAAQMRDLSRVVPEGAVVAAVLETAIDSDLPGSVRGVVSRDVRSFDGSRVLIPRGSRLVGEYKSASGVGQNRAFVVWDRIITPTGVTVQIGSPATDRLGRGGLGGEVDRHFTQRFGAAILLTVLQAGTTALASNGAGSTVIIGAPASLGQVSQGALQSDMNIPDTIRVAQGEPVQVLVARDLDFAAVVR